MTNEVTVEIKLDADLKEAAEKLYSRIGLTIEEAIPLLVKYNVEQDEKPFVISEDTEEEDIASAFGALAKYANPAMIPFEDGAWERLVAKKYVGNIG